MLEKFFFSERNIMVAILLNAIILFAMYFPAYRDNPTLEGIDHVFLLFFLLEAIVKIYALGVRDYFKNPWNRFDFIIVMASLPSVLVAFVDIPDTSLLIILRLFRLIRLIRFFRFVPHLNKIIDGLGRALQASLFVLLALIFLNILLAIFTCHFYANIAPEYFGDPLISSYSIFQMFTIEGWNEIPAVIAERVQKNGSDSDFIGTAFIIGITRFYFVFVVLIGGIFGMSLANAVFVDEMTMDNNQSLEAKIDKLQEEIAELKQLLKKRG
ncbi:MAG: ion transporter [Phaeodactylibacter sp.]|nr:ion transporter [Phaeodactylibacter sp.]